MALDIPKRIVLRFDQEYELDWEAIIQTSFATFGSNQSSDFYPHLMAPNMSTKMHIVLDLHCKTVSSVDSSAIEYEVFKVEKAGELYVVQPSEMIMTEMGHRQQLSRGSRWRTLGAVRAFSW